MASTIILKRSAVPNKIPLTSSISLGEMAINTHDGIVYIKKDDGITESIVKILSNQDIDTDDTFSSNSDNKIPSQKAVKSAIDTKQDVLVSGTNIKTINNKSIVGSGDLLVSLDQKSGIVANTSFSGTPKKYNVVFSTPYIDANYTISIVGVDSRAWTVETITENGFTINANANQNLTGNVYWTTTKNGEA